jgi:hypothetical protein
VTGGLAAPLLRALTGAAMIRHLIARLVGYAIALVLLATAFGFLVATLYLALARIVEPPLAALLTALALGGAAGLILLIVRYRRSRRRIARAVEADALLLSITDQVRRDPWRALAVAAVLGALAEIARPSSDRPPG